MYLISFELDQTKLKFYCEENSNIVIEKIKNALETHDFLRINNTTYINSGNNISCLFEAIFALKKIDWFDQIVNSLYNFKAEEYYDLTNIVKATG